LYLFLFFSIIGANNKNMSYQSYVDEEFVGSGHVPQALICGLDGNTIASSSGFRVRICYKK
jgi:hypothetical protein